VSRSGDKALPCRGVTFVLSPEELGLGFGFGLGLRFGLGLK
jgi:hypothetical protein